MVPTCNLLYIYHHLMLICQVVPQVHRTHLRTMNITVQNIVAIKPIY